MKPETANTMTEFLREREHRYVYFIEAEGLDRIKIGKTDDLRTRFRDLAAASPVPLRVLLVLRSDAMSERRLHRIFHADRVHGEWFRASDEIRDFIAARLRDMTIPVALKNPHREGPWHPLRARSPRTATGTALPVQQEPA